MGWAGLGWAVRGGAGTVEVEAAGGVLLLCHRPEFDHYIRVRLGLGRGLHGAPIGRDAEHELARGYPLRPRTHRHAHPRRHAQARLHAPVRAARAGRVQARQGTRDWARTLRALRTAASASAGVECSQGTWAQRS
jgi:hypothetical protein